MSYAAMLMGVLTMAGCAEVTPGFPLEDAGTERDAEMTRDDGALRVEMAWWREAGDLRVVVSMINRQGGPLDVGPESFVLRSRTGVIVPARAAGIGGCESEGLVLPGDEARCTLRFSYGGEPDYLEHTMGLARVHACRPSHPFGLCEPGASCLGGACHYRCSPAHQDGVCSNDAEVCQAGECVTSCNDDPDSGCEEGVCVDGRCELQCRSLAIVDHHCWGCMWDLLDSGACPIDDRCRDCGECSGTRTFGEPPMTDCDCLEQDSCDGCDEPAQDYWQCIVDACPLCAE